MEGFTRILCPVDTSPFSKRALQYSVALAGWYEAQLTVLWVRPTSVPPSLWIEYPVALPLEASDARARTEGVVRSFVRETVGPVAAEVLVREGFVVPEILRCATEMQADLIVMGTHGLSGLEHVLVGSVTNGVLHHAPCAVLTVPRAPADAVLPHVTFRTILCAIDFSRDSERALHYALSLAQEAGGRLLLVHVLEQFGADYGGRLNAHFSVPEFRRALEQDARERLQGLIPEEARAWCDPEVVIGYGRAYREVLRVSDERGADLIVLGVHGRNAAELALFGSTARHVVHHAATPVLTVPRVAGAATAAAA